MVARSRFTHCFDLGDSVAMYHSLRMKPVYLKKDKYTAIQYHLGKKECSSVSDFPISLEQEIKELVKNKILIQSSEEDDKVLNFIRSRLPQPSLSVVYFILSEQCNLACGYCFLGNNDPEKRKMFSLESMSKETAEKALSFYLHQLELSGEASVENKPTIIFYGGEPLLNFEVLEYVASRVKTLRQTMECIRNVELSVVTNGVLLDEYKLKRLRELGVALAISIDGCTEKANSLRVDRYGNTSFIKVINALEMAKKIGIDISLSLTLTEETIKDKENILSLINKYNIKGLGFNILMSDETFKPSNKYNEEASQFIIDMFVELRKIGVYEDRIMRKLKAFAKSQIYYSDCAATSGSQLVFTPDGSVGVCHGCLANRKYFISTIDDDSFDIRTNKVFVEWSQITPVNKTECLSCEALGICGGGCPVNALNSAIGNTINSIDERFCVHAKKTLNFLIHDLYEIISKENEILKDI